MAARKSVFVLYLVAATVGILFALEFVCMRLNAARGVVLPFAVARPGTALHHQKEDRFGVLDPHLGYAHGVDEASVRALGDKWVNGFVVYRDQPGPLVHPVILALGGSTTDGAGADKSWPEELARLLKDQGIAGTVVNGGTGGYSTNQELMKLIRDGLEFRPDIVISYSGVNDRGEYGELPYPMVHAYQRQVLEHLTEGPSSRLLPNTVAWIRHEVLPRAKHPVTSTLGVASSSTLGEQYERNLVLMDAIARARGAAFFGFIQPNAYFRTRHSGKPGEAKSPSYVASLLALYAEIIDVPERLPFVRDFTGIFEPHDDVYRGDGVHTTPKGDAIIAQEILAVISGELKRRS